MKVSEAMTTNPVFVTLGTPLKEVAELLVEQRISGVPVLDEEGALRGIVSEADFVAKQAGAEEKRTSWASWLTGGWREEHHQRAMAAARTAGEAMTSPAVTINANCPLSEAAHRMAELQINRLPVVDGARMVGIVTRADIVRAYARTDQDLREAVATALRSVEGLSVVDVRDGVAALSGTVASEALAHAISAMVRQIDGVVAVDDRELNWMPAPSSLATG